jgi:hypothetical protein
MNKFPNFFIVGAPKCGTTSLGEYLNQNPDVFFPERKEIHYFDVNTKRDSNSHNWIRTEQDYLELYRSVNGEKIIGDATSSYLSDSETPKLIHEQVPNARILISLRNPVKQIFSFYVHRFRDGLEKRNFNDVIIQDLEKIKQNDIKDNIFRYAMFSDDVKNYINEFGESKVKIIFFEEWITNINKTLFELESFLEIQNYSKYQILVENPHINKNNPLIKISKNPTINTNLKKIIPKKTLKRILNFYITKIMTKPKINPEDELFLKKAFGEDVKELEKILNRKIPWDL